MSTAGDSGGDDSMGDGRKGGKRELSQSKRAAQNRAAQVCCPVFIIETRIAMEVEAQGSLKVVMVSLLCQFSCHPNQQI